jgi:hypothetical protein
MKFTSEGRQQQAGSNNEDPISELARLLAQKLSASDFAHVCEILANKDVLSAPGLIDELRRRFRQATGNDDGDDR